MFPRIATSRNFCQSPRTRICIHIFYCSKGKSSTFPTADPSQFFKIKKYSNSYCWGKLFYEFWQKHVLTRYSFIPPCILNLPLLLNLATSNLFCILIIFPFLECPIRGTVQFEPFLVSVTYPNMFVIHSYCACFNSQFLFIAE